MTVNIRRLSYILFPARCCVCDRVVPPGKDMCPECAKTLISYPAKRAYCKICGVEYENCTCGKRLLYSTATSPFYYENNTKRSLLKMKFNGRLDLIKPFAKYMTEVLEQRGITESTDIITFIPMRRNAVISRGYNQAEKLATEIGRLTGIPVKPLLKKISSTPKQHRLGMHRRRGNIMGVFDPADGCSEDITGKNILVADDIITTGSTLNEAAKTLLIFGAERVDVTAVAMGRKRRKINNHNKRSE